MRENCTYGSMRGRAYPITRGVPLYSTPHCIPQTELAKRMKVSRPYITKVLHQDVNITFRTAEKLATALRMDFFPDLRPREVTQKLPNMV